jgi:Spy/CpxP family protein refolding chaperone
LLKPLPIVGIMLPVLLSTQWRSNMAFRWAILSAGLMAAAVATAQPYGMGPGMMGGYGPGYGMGPGMMGGYGPGYGMGPGMMGGYGMGPGMMGGWGRGGWGLEGLGLSDEQRSKISDIQRDLSRLQWDLMRSMHEQDWHMGDAWRDGGIDEKAARKAFDAMTEMHRKMFDATLEARKRVDALLTPQQREQLRRGTTAR